MAKRRIAALDRGFRASRLGCLLIVAGLFYIRACNCNLTRLSRLLRILQFHAHDLKSRALDAAYIRPDRGQKRRLRFTKTRDAKLEKAYSTHFAWPGKGPWHTPGMGFGGKIA